MINWGTLIRDASNEQIGMGLEWRARAKAFVFRLTARELADADYGDYFAYLSQQLLAAIDYAEKEGFSAFLWDMSEFYPDLHLGNASGIILEDAVARAKATPLHVASIVIHEEHQTAGRLFLGDDADILFKPSEAEIDGWFTAHSA